MDMRSDRYSSYMRNMTQLVESQVVMSSYIYIYIAKHLIVSNLQGFRGFFGFNDRNGAVRLSVRLSALHCAGSRRLGGAVLMADLKG